MTEHLFFVSVLGTSVTVVFVVLLFGRHLLITAVHDIQFSVLVISFHTDILNIAGCLSIKNNDEHKSCQEEYQKLKHEFEQYKQSQLHQPNNIR